MNPNLAKGLAYAAALIIGVALGHYHGKAETLDQFVNYNVAMMERLK